MCHVKTAEPIEMPYGKLNRVSPCIKTGIEITHGNGQFWELSGPPKSTRSLCWGIHSARDHSVFTKGMTADCNAADWSVSHYIVPVKNLPAMRRFVKLFDNLLDPVMRPAVEWRCVLFQRREWRTWCPRRSLLSRWRSRPWWHRKWSCCRRPSRRETDRTWATSRTSTSGSAMSVDAATTAASVSDCPLLGSLLSAAFGVSLCSVQ